MKINLERAEAAELMAGYHAMLRIEDQIRQLTALHARHMKRREEIEAAIRERITDLPKTPIAQWRFNLDPVAFDGDVEVPDVGEMKE